MESFLTNKNALIWAFNENIDKDTKFEGNTRQQSIDETKNLINYLKSEKCFDANITESILNEYLDALDRTKIDFPKYEGEVAPKDLWNYWFSKEMHFKNKYFLLGWNGHAILLFLEKTKKETLVSGEIFRYYNLGLINCGEGIDIQGNNGILCNGLIIFKDIQEQSIISFFNTYKSFYEGSYNDDEFHKNKVYYIFYFILNYFILNTKNPVNYETLDSSIIALYKLESQLIGSCAFTNLINLIYYIQLTKQPEKKEEECYRQYLTWYNNSKKIIKKKIYADILKSRDFSYYNMYQYILDTTDATKNEEYETIVKNKIIDKISYKIEENSEKNISIIIRNTACIIKERTKGIEDEARENNYYEEEKKSIIETLEREKSLVPSKIAEENKYKEEIITNIDKINKKGTSFYINFTFKYISTQTKIIDYRMTSKTIDAFKTLLVQEKEEVNKNIAEQEAILTSKPVFPEKTELSPRIIKQKSDDDIFNKKIPLIKAALWDSYDNYNFIKLREILEESSYSDEILDTFINFYREIKLSDNGFVLFYILYKINKEKLITEENYKKLEHKILNIYGSITDQFHRATKDQRKEYYIRFDLNNVLKSCIFMLLNKDRILKDEKYYSKDDGGYIEKKRKNIIFYNYFLFSNFPIINCNYELIVSEIINELNENIEIFPDYNIYDFKKVHQDVCISIEKEKKEKIFCKFLCMNNENDCKYIIISNDKKTSYLLDYILFNDDKLIYLNHEKFGYYIPDIYKSQIEENCIINTLNENIDNGFPGGFKLHKQKIILFKEKIKENLIRNIHIKPTFDLLKDYSIYFYLSELDGTKIEDEIYNKYNKNIYDYFEELIKIIPEIVYTYTLKYSQTFISEKFNISFDDTYIITNSEKKYFEQKSYECILKEEHVYHSVIDFFIIKYSSYNVVIYKDEKNTIESINIIKDLIIKYDTIYFALNFYFIKDGENISGINKNNESVLLTFTNSDEILYKDSDSELYIFSDLKKILKYDDLPIVYKNFYNLMSNNDIGLFIYTYKTKKSKNVYFLKTLNYDFIFEMSDDSIYYTIKDTKYIVHYCDDIDLFNNYGILKLEHPETPIYDKLLCIYNYKHILSPNRSYEKDNFINNTFKDLENISDINKNNESATELRYYYKIINKYNDKYIFLNIDEVNALLINCFNYNSPYLILKNIEQIRDIIFNSKKNESIFINTLFTRFINIYSIQISLLFYNNKILNEYYYIHADIIFKKYNILLELVFERNKENKFLYYTLNNNINELATKYSEDYLYELFFLNSYLFATKSPKRSQYGDRYDGLSIFGTVINNTYKIDKIDKIDWEYRYNYYKNTYSNDLSNPSYSNNNLLVHRSETNTINIIVKIPKYYDDKIDCSYSFKIKYNEFKIKNKSEFEILSKLFIPIGFNQEVFTQNITKATELFNYLISEDKKELFPIQELIMGSGKTTSITPYICILLLNHFISSGLFNNEIFIVMPEFLINSSFEILMKYLFPLFNNIEILINPNTRRYQNSVIINLISDNNYKLLFLEKEIETYDMYMIYDEVDMMANPLSCELNIPFNKEELTHTDELYKLANVIYNDIFKNETFWESITNSNNNKIHNYIYNLDKPTIDTIDHFYNELIEKNFSQNKEEIKSLLDYVKQNILYFLLTKQYNFDYGMPEFYYGNIDINYIYKAIPYTAVDNPAMGSEFSDSILTYILTIFCYKIVDGEYRNIDKEFIINYYEQNKDIIQESKFFELFDEKPLHYDLYKKNRDFYKSKSKKKFEIDTDIFDNILKNILNLNDTYYKNCKNISFNDLLLHKNVKNFVSFTGTAYIKPPIGCITDLNFNKDTYINFSKIPPYSSVLDAVMNIICDETKLKNINVNNNLFIEDIFCCLNQYEVLIDIGGIFIKYNINSFIDEYKKLKNFKEHIVYFDNGRKIYNIHTHQFVNDDSINHTNAFYYFSNKNITGVDAKNIMNPKAHGLVTITNKTNLRDFSQGIFRMRNILDPEKQTFDIIFNKKIKDIIIGGCDNFKKIEKKENIREKIIRSLVSQQEILDKQKEKILIKQNIFGLKKPNTYDLNNQQILYLDPMTWDYTNAFSSFNSYIQKYTPIINNFNIDSYNIIDKNKKKTYDSYEDDEEEPDENQKLINELIDKYFTLDTIIYEVKQNVVVEEAREVAREEEKVDEQISEKIKQKILLMNTMIAYPEEINNKPGIIYYNLRFNGLINNQIFIDCKDTYNLLLIYDSNKNNLAIISTLVLDRFLMYNENILEYTYISLFNNSVYGKKIDDDLYGYLIRECTKILIYISRYVDEKEKLDKLINRLIQYKFNEKYVFIKEPLQLAYINYKVKGSYGGSYNKYVKYKEKYLQLKKKINSQKI